METNNTNTNQQGGQVTQKLFTELFRPKTLEQAIIVPRIREELSRGLVDNILLEGTPGTGKTSLTRILSQGHDVLEINASLERGIDIIREKVQMFASTSSLFNANKLKIIVLEECDNLTADAWLSLRAMMEKYHNNVRFIANCNYMSKIPEPLLSRFNCISINAINTDEENYIMNEYATRVGGILDYLKVSYTKENLDLFIKNNYPDLRAIMKKLQQMYTRGIKELGGDMLKSSFDGEELFKIIVGQPNPVENYKYIVSEWGNKTDEAVLAIGQNFPSYIMANAQNLIPKLPMIIIAIAEHNSMLATSIDKVVTLESLVFKLQLICNG